MPARKLTVALLAALICAMSACVLYAGDYSEYDTNDVVAFGALIRRHGIDADPDAPESWGRPRVAGSVINAGEGEKRGSESLAVWGDGSPRRIKAMRFSGSDISGHLDLTPFGALESLKILSSDIESIDLSKSVMLTRLEISGAYLCELDLSACPKLVTLYCTDSGIEWLDVSGCPALAHLDCSGNELTELELYHSPLLREIDCRDNPIRELDLSLCPNITSWRVSPGTEVFAGLSEIQVRSAWEDVCSAAGIRELPLRIEHEAAPNAWIDIRSHVSVTTGLMRILSREEEMAGVLLHEASHARLNHVKDKAANNLAVLLIFGAIGAAIDKPVGWAGAAVAAKLAMSGFSREQEVAADDLATDIAISAGLDPTGIYNALERMAIVSGRSRGGGFRTHPPEGRRLGRIERRIHAALPDAEIKKILGLPELPAEGREQTEAKEPEDESSRESRERRRRIDELMRELDMGER